MKELEDFIKACGGMHSAAEHLRAFISGAERSGTKPPEVGGWPVNPKAEDGHGVVNSVVQLPVSVLAASNSADAWGEMARKEFQLACIATKGLRPGHASEHRENAKIAGEIEWRIRAAASAPSGAGASGGS